MKDIELPPSLGYMNAEHVHELQQGRLHYGYVYSKAGTGAEEAVFTADQLRAATAPLLARIAELEAGDEEALEHQEWWNSRMLELERENAELVKALEEARKDAERYRRLRHACCEGYPSGEGSSSKDAYLVITGYDDLYPMTDAQKDASIDAAIKEQTK